MRYGGSRRRRVSILTLLLASAVVAGFGLLIIAFRSVDPDPAIDREDDTKNVAEEEESQGSSASSIGGPRGGGSRTCATVEMMGSEFHGGFAEQSLRVREIIRRHFALNGASAIHELPSDKFCRHGFVLGKTAEAGFGNEIYKILTSAALSIMLNRSLIIGQTRGKYPFGDYIAYSNITFTMNEVKHLWRQKGCVKNYGRHLNMKIDDFQKPAKTNTLCSNWIKWEEPIIWFQGTTDAVAAQFFLKNVHSEMRLAASELFGEPGSLKARANTFGELMRVLISPTEDVQEAVNWVLGKNGDPDISLHMRMLMNRPIRALKAALNCLGKAINILQESRPKVVIVSDTPSLVKSIQPNISAFAEVVYFDYKAFRGGISRGGSRLPILDFRIKDWGPAPRWVAFVDFFLASRAKHTVISGAHRRVGTTYAQLLAALAAANSLEDNSTGSNFSFLSSFQSNLLTDGLKNQVGWGHVWNRFAGPLSCPNQPNQCALTPLIPPGWWDGLWQSPIPRDIRRLAAYGVELSGFGTVNEDKLRKFCNSKKESVNTVTIV